MSHVGDLGGIPLADRRVFTGAAVSAAAALGLGLAAVEAGGHRSEAVVHGGLERGAVGEGLGLSGLSRSLSSSLRFSLGLSLGFSLGLSLRCSLGRVVGCAPRTRAMRDLRGSSR